MLSKYYDCLGILLHMFSPDCYIIISFVLFFLFHKYYVISVVYVTVNVCFVVVPFIVHSAILNESQISHKHLIVNYYCKPSVPVE